MKLLHISDIHLRRDDKVSACGWKRLQALVADLRPDLIVNTGDNVHDDPHAAADQNFAAACLRDLGIEVLSIPGNHDVGDGPPRATAPEPALLAAYPARFGSPHWVRGFGAWRLVGVDSMLLGAAVAAEADEWRWLEQALQGGSEPVALFMHKPPFLEGPDEDAAGSAAMPPDARRRLWALVRAHDVRLIGCGHRHEYRAVLCQGVLSVWAPTTSTLLDEVTSPFSPLPFPGAVEYCFSGQTVLHRVIPLA